MMDTLPLPPKAPVLASDVVARQQQAVTTQPAGSEATQTVQAVQAAQHTATPDLSPEQLSQMAEEMQTFVGSFNRSLQFKVDEDSGRNVVTVLDGDTGDVIRQIPSEELLDVIARLNEASGGLLDTQA